MKTIIKETWKEDKRLIFWIIFLLMLLIMMNSVSALTPPTNGVSYWNLSSNTDLWGSNDLTSTDSPTSVNFYPSFNVSGSSQPNSYSFDASNDDLSTPATTGIVGDEGTISIWVYPKDLFVGRRVLDERTNSNYNIRVANINKLSFTFIDETPASKIYQTDSLSLDTWYHLVASWDSNGITYYLDGINKSYSSWTGGLYNAGENDGFNIGTRRDNQITDSAGIWNGYIDEIKVFDSSLTELEVSNLYNYGNVLGAPAVGNFTITAFDYFGVSISNFSVVVDGTDNYNTSTGSITTNLYNNDSSLHDFVVDGNNYASVTENDYNVSFNYVATLYSYNSVRVYAFDSDSGDVIEDFNISLLSGTTYYENSSSDNYTYFPTILEGEYVVRFTAINYSLSNYIITMYDNSYQVLNIYATANATSQNVIFNVYDVGSNSVLEDVLITQKKILLGGYVTIESKLSDISGRAQFTYYEDIPYYFVASKNGYVTREFSLTPLFASYDVRMYPSVSSNYSVFTDDVVVTAEDYVFSNSTSYILTSFFSPLGSLEYYSVNVTLDNGTSFVVDDNIAVGSYINVSFVNGAVSFGDSAFVTFTYKSTLNAGEKKISRVFLFSTWDAVDGGINSLKDSFAGYSDFEKIFWLSLITIALASLFSIFGFASGEYFVFACIGGLFGIVAGGVLGLINWVVGGFVIFLLLLFIIGKVINSG